MVSAVLLGKQWLARLPPARLAAAAAALAVLAVASFTFLSILRDEGRPSGVTEIDPSELGLASLLDSQGILDSDLDGLPDAVENLVYGSDPAKWNSSGSQIPDGWLARNGKDPNNDQVGSQPAAVPPTGALPKAYGNRWPDRFTLSLLQAYSFGRPTNWTEASSGPFDSGIDPRKWDQNGDGLPDGWLVHYGLDPRAPELAGQRLAGPNGLTVAEAFKHNTDPRSLDSDRDGLLDRDELDGPTNPTSKGPARFPRTDPARADTGGAGVCDGYLVRHGLDPNDPQASLADLDRDGATTAEEYAWSANHTAQACTAGGLDPTKQATGGGQIPEGWLIQHGLDALDPKVSNRTTQTAEQDPRPAGVPAPASSLRLTVLDEYLHGRPDTWSEPRDGPWLGGTDPRSNDTDKDGLGDAWEIAGYRLLVAAEPSLPAGISYNAALDPTQSDSDGDGLLDVDEVKKGTDGRRPDTDFDGLDDGLEDKLGLGLNATRADSTSTASRGGDLLRDGARHALLVQRSADALAGVAYPYDGPPGAPRPLSAWMAALPGAGRLGGSASVSQLAGLLAPAGDADGDGAPNILDPDIDEDGVVNGPELDPREHQATRFGLGPLNERSVTDPLNPDTDGDLLRDAWEFEHGILQGGRITLDPARWDSDGDCILAATCQNDGAEDPDQDGIEWPRFVARAGVPTLENLTFPFTNVREQAAGTDPNQPESDGDGLRDGWKAFWGIEYPLKPRDAATLGLTFPSTIPESPRPTPGTPQQAGTPEALVRAVPYWRSAVYGSPLASQFGEQTLSVTPVGSLQVANVTGTIRLDFQDIQGIGTNPYLADTDGDGMPDWWEHLHGAPLPGMPGSARCVQGGLDALRHEPNGDPDDDGLVNALEFAHASDPLCADSDLGGVPDGEEVLRATSSGQLDPTDPKDDASLLQDDIDQDLDGAPDFNEITELGSRYDHPDTDGDGLLDGPSMPQTGCWQPLSSGGNATARRFLDLGIAYIIDQRTVAGTSVSCHVFLGERDPQFFFNPVNGDDHGIGVPAGWILMKTSAFDANNADHVKSARENYNLGRPAWWTEDVHGPWWGGTDPQSPDYPFGNVRHSPDLDGDGLRDTDPAGLPSEDSFPAANPSNQRRSVAGLSPDLDPLDADADRLLRRLAAQATLNPAPYLLSTRNTVPHPSFEETVDPRGEVCMSLSASGGVRKGTPTMVTGALHRRVDGTCTDQAVPGIAVEAVMGGQVFGAGFTDHAGQFILPVNVSSAQRSVAIPPDANSAFQGQQDGAPAWRPDASASPVGPRTLVVRSYANETLRAAEKATPVLVSAGASLVVDVAGETRTDRPVAVHLELRDTAGAPLRDPVRVFWIDRWLPDVTPDPDGSADLRLPGVPVGDAGNVTLHLLSRPATTYTDPAQAIKTVWARMPGVIEVEDPERVDAGQVAIVRGEYRALAADRTEAGVDDATIDLSIALPSGAVQVTTKTDDGRFRVELPLPAGTPPGQHVVRASARGTDESSPASDETTLAVRGLPRFDQVLDAPLGEGPHRVAARLTAADGRPLAGLPVSIALGKAKAPPVTTDDAGLAVTELDASFPAGPVRQTLTFAGNDLYAAAKHVSQRFAGTATEITLPAGTLSRGAAAQVPVVLTDGAGAPIPRASVTVRWGDEAPQRLLTDSNGKALFARPAPETERLGTVLVTARYAGSESAGLVASNASQTWTVRAQARFEVPDDAVVAGGPMPRGRLLDDGTGQPLAYRTIRRGSGAEQATLLSDSQGWFPLLPAAPGPGAAPAPMVVPLHYAGDTEYPSAQAQATLRIVSPVTLSAQVPPSMDTGKPILAHAHLVDGRGAVPTGGRVQVHWQDQLVAEADLVGSPARLSLLIPANASAGAATLAFSYTGSATHATAFDNETTHFVRGATLVAKAFPARSGGTTVLQVTLAAGDVPLPDRKVLLALGGAPAGLEAVTDADGVATFSVLQSGSKLEFLARAPGDSEVAAAATAGVVQAMVPPTLGERGVSWLALGAAAGALLLAVALVLALRSRDPLGAALHQARRVLHARGPDERRVLEAYMALENAAISTELLSSPANTPRALEAVLASRLPPAAHPPLGRLMEIFEAARYGGHRIQPEHRATALACLDQVQRALLAGASA